MNNRDGPCPFWGFIVWFEETGNKKNQCLLFRLFEVEILCKEEFVEVTDVEERGSCQLV